MVDKRLLVAGGVAVAALAGLALWASTRKPPVVVALPPGQMPPPPLPGQPPPLSGLTPGQFNPVLFTPVQGQKTNTSHVVLSGPYPSYGAAFLPAQGALFAVELGLDGQYYSVDPNRLIVQSAPPTQVAPPTPPVSMGTVQAPVAGLVMTANHVVAGPFTDASAANIALRIQTGPAAIQIGTDGKYYIVNPNLPAP